MVDTNSDPRDVDFVIPANDDATKSISAIVGYMTESIKEGLAVRKTAKSKTEKKVEKPIAAKAE